MSARRFKVGDLAIVIGGRFPQLLGRVVEVTHVFPLGTLARHPLQRGRRPMDYLVDYLVDGEAVVEFRRDFGVPPGDPVAVQDKSLQPLHGDPDAEADVTDDELAEADAALVGGLR